MKKLTTLITESKDYSSLALADYRSVGPVYFLEDLRSCTALKKEIDILVVRLNYQINKHWIESLPNLKLIATPTTGLNHIDTKYAEAKGIKVISLRGHASFLKNVSSTAELALGLMLALVRNIPSAFESVKSGVWDRTKFRGYQLSGQTLGILGLGRLGRIMAKYGRAVGMKVIAHDPYIPISIMKKMGVQEVSMNTLFKISDIISLHVLLDNSTHNLVKENHLKLMKPSAYLINTARAELVEKDALIKALKNRWISGAAVDVLWDEKGNGSHLKNNPLIEYARKNNNFIVVPHIGGATFEAMHSTEEFIAGLVRNCFKTKKLE